MEKGVGGPGAQRPDLDAVCLPAAVALPRELSGVRSAGVDLRDLVAPIGVTARAA